MTLQARPPLSIQRGFLFGDVAVDAARRQLFVRGREVRCRPLPFELLLQLCEAGGAVVPREEVFQRLWGEAYTPSDESLTQAVHRLRSTLGADGKAVRTVRGVGLRLDAQVVPIATEGLPPAAPPDLATRPLPAEQPEAVPAPLPEAALPATPAPRRRSFRTPIAGAAAAVLLALLAFGFWWARRPVLIDPGYALTVADLGSRSPVTEDLVRRAFAAEAQGDRAQAVELLETANRSDPATPVPAVFLSLWSDPEKEPGERQRWALTAQGRLEPGSSPHAQLLVRYAKTVADGSSAEAEAALSALLDLRPDAWRLRLARELLKAR